LGSRWFPVAVVAAIVVAGVLIAAAIFFKGEGDQAPAPSVAPTTEAAADSATCLAWAKAKYDLSHVTPMPPGFVYGAPGVDELADTRAARLQKVLAAFESQIESTPEAVAAAAHRVVDASMDEADKLSGRLAIGPADANAVGGARRELDGLCAG
jgi:hypothetical protein